MQTLLSGEVAPWLRDAPIGHHDDDIGPVDGPSRPIEDLKVGCADCGSSVAAPAVFALDDPAPSMGVGAFHISPQVSPSSYTECVRTAIASHQVPDRDFELLVRERVELRDGISEGALLDSFPLHTLSAPLPPSASGQRDQQEGSEKGPPMCQQPVDHYHHESDDDCRGDPCDGELRVLFLAAPAWAAGGASPRGLSAGHRLLPRVEKSMG